MGGILFGKGFSFTGIMKNYFHRNIKSFLRVKRNFRSGNAAFLKQSNETIQDDLEKVSEITKGEEMVRCSIFGSGTRPLVVRPEPVRHRHFMKIKSKRAVYMKYNQKLAAL